MVKLNGTRYIIFLSFLKVSLQARILGVLPTPSYSHQIVFKQFWKELALKGHDVTVITTDPSNDKTITNLREIDVSFAYGLWNDYNIAGVFEETSGHGVTFVLQMNVILSEIMDKVLAHPEVEELINNKTEYFDLVMIEEFYTILYAFKHRFNCSLIGISSFDVSPFGHAAVGNPSHPIANPDQFLNLSGNLSFFERLLSVIFTNIMYLYDFYYCTHGKDALIKKHFGEGYPSILKLAEEIDMLFINIHPVLHDVRPIVPATIMIGGGVHFEPPKLLPNDLQQYLDESQTGVIYINLGSNVSSRMFSINTKSIIMKVLSELPFNVIWKYESDDLTGKPDKIRLIKWAPQQDILRHPNVVLFISQCDLQSVEEAIFNAIPVLAMPMFAGQETNAKLIQNKGFGIHINWVSMTKSEFKKTILLLITNSIYKNKAKQLSRHMLDEPMSALNKTVWWTEFVLRNKGNIKHLQSEIINIPAYQYYLLDVIAYFVFIVIVSLYSISVLFKLFKNMCCNKIMKKEKTN